MKWSRIILWVYGQRRIYHQSIEIETNREESSEGCQFRMVDEMHENTIRKIKLNQLSICVTFAPYSSRYCNDARNIIIKNNNNRVYMVSIRYCKCDYCTIFIWVSARCPLNWILKETKQNKKKCFCFFSSIRQHNAITLIKRILYEWLEDSVFFSLYGRFVVFYFSNVYLHLSLCHARRTFYYANPLV